MLSSFKTLALATSANRPERKSELYDERLTGEESSLFRSLKFLFFLSIKRVFLDEDTVVLSTAPEAEKSWLAVIVNVSSWEKYSCKTEDNMKLSGNRCLFNSSCQFI